MEDVRVCREDVEHTTSLFPCLVKQCLHTCGETVIPCGRSCELLATVMLAALPTTCEGLVAEMLALAPDDTWIKG
ncbi:hypothetical protein E2C01_019472 [Portunus trituberculatus]|uniref:Uncharacterized protein n=1 Tax=Portunus trituberculatus TaxID=210409 RepID=A0A5B7DZ27_PORTR|nr:hypothetical protein [Portunus trituberculatus]